MFSNKHLIQTIINWKMSLFVTLSREKHLTDLAEICQTYNLELGISQATFYPLKV